MIINRGETAGIEYLEERPEAVLFLLEDGSYHYVEQGIVENELRVMQNWHAAKCPGTSLWRVHFTQGTEIPQELGDWIVTTLQTLP